jgi:hypothetical protein
MGFLFGRSILFEWIMRRSLRFMHDRAVSGTPRTLQADPEVKLH